jgi:hypothetical protein
MVQDGAQDNDDSLVLLNRKINTDGGNKAKSAPKEDPEDDLGSADAEDDSIAKAVASVKETPISVRRAMYARGQGRSRGKIKQNKGWKPIPKVTSTLEGSQPSQQEEAQSSAKKRGHNFIRRQSSLPENTGKKNQRCKSALFTFASSFSMATRMYQSQ